MFLWISSISCPGNLLLLQIHQAEIIIVKGLIQRRNKVTRVRIEARLCDQDRRKNDAFIFPAMLPAAEAYIACGQFGKLNLRQSTV